MVVPVLHRVQLQQKSAPSPISTSSNRIAPLSDFPPSPLHPTSPSIIPDTHSSPFPLLHLYPLNISRNLPTYLYYLKVSTLPDLTLPYLTVPYLPYPYLFFLHLTLLNKPSNLPIIHHYQPTTSPPKYKPNTRNFQFPATPRPPRTIAAPFSRQNLCLSSTPKPPQREQLHISAPPVAKCLISYKFTSTVQCSTSFSTKVQNYQQAKLPAKPCACLNSHQPDKA